MPRIIYALLSTSVATLLATGVSAKENNNTEQLLVITANRTAVSTNELLNNTEQLTQDEINFIEATHITEALQNISGTWISRGNGQEHLTAIRSPVFTGPGSCGEFLVLEDGIPVRSPGFCNVNQLFDVNSEQAQRIEVVKGPNSALYGSNAIHGMINVINVLPQDNRSNASLLFGDHGYSRLKTHYSRISDSSSTATAKGFALSLNTTKDNGFKDDSGFNQQKLHLSHIDSYKNLTISSRLSASRLDQQTAGFLQQGENAYRLDEFLRTNEFPEAFRNAWSLRLQTKIASQSHSKETYSKKAYQHSWHFTPYFRSNKMQFLMHFLPGQPLEENGHKSLGFQFASNYSEKNWQFHWGIDNELTDGFLTQTQATATETGSAFLDETLPQGNHYNYDVKALNAGIFAKWRYQLNNKWSVNLGSRFDYVEYNYDNHLASGNLRDNASECGFGGCRYTRPDDRSDSFDSFSWSVASGYNIDKTGLIYLKIDRAFRAPQTTELYRLQNGQTTAEINETKADAVELGFRHQYLQLSERNGQVNINLYHMKKSDVIFQNNDRAIVTGAETLHRGIELSWQQNLHDVYIVTSASYAKHTYNNSVDLRGLENIDIKNNLIDTAPKLIANLRAGWHYRDNSKLELSWGLLDKYYTNPENTRLYKGHELVDLRLQQQLNDSWQLFARIKNLTDKRYAERADFAFGNDRYFVGEPRSYYLGISYSGF
jgi:outer membrane receptor protein involved in Fe transport